MASYFTKDPDEALDYVIDWTAWLRGDTVTGASWVVTAGLTKADEAFTGQTATVWLSGGVAVTQYAATCTVTTAGGRVGERSITITVRNTTNLVAVASGVPGAPGSAILTQAYVDAADTTLAAAVALKADATALTAETDARLEAVAAKIDTTEARQVASVSAPTIVTLLAGQPDETITGAAWSADSANYKVGDRGAKITGSGTGTVTVIYTPVAPILTTGAASIAAWVYVPSLAGVTSMTVQIFSGANVWSRSATAAALAVGWNLLRWQSTAGTITGWGSVTQVRVQLATTALVSVTVGHLWAECPPKAQLLFIVDRGYRTFVDAGLADLRALGIPVTWALDPALNGTSVGTRAEVVTDADVAAFADAGDSISLHGWDGSVTSTMTADQVRADTLKAVRWLQQRGHAGRMWRAAWVQNSAPQAAAARDYILAGATPSSSAALTCWPPPDRWNIPRVALHGLTSAQVDGYFAQLETTHQLMVVYTHGIHADGLTGGADSTPAQWAYFVAKVSAAVAAGWLEGVTFEDLYGRSGGKFRQVFGQAQAEYVDEKGVLVRRDML